MGSINLGNVKGSPGVGVPTGGTAGQVLAKIDGTNYNTQWVNQSGGANILGTYITETTVVNTTTETTVYSGLTISANTMGVTGGLKVIVDFDENHSVVANTFIRVKLGGTECLAFRYPQGAQSALKPSRLTVEGRNIGATNKQRWFATIQYQDGTAINQIYDRGETTIDTTQNLSFILTAQHSVADSGVYYKQYSVVVEKIIG